MNRSILKAVAIAAACIFIAGTSRAQTPAQPGSRLAVSGHGWYGIDMEKISLFFDFGGNPAGTEVTVSDIYFAEHK